ncbi:hypothetical protein INT47_005447 [Mucor saturninus]|uniref:NodB homology domain-containing protein n=1 Tax=Mucor saturninus TaxID=64648 RepID=A0A8H7RER8_9FUNG|nr:hypothetical protein INT47_005447 [Mucor saturninus]
MKLLLISTLCLTSYFVSAAPRTLSDTSDQFHRRSSSPTSNIVSRSDRYDQLSPQNSPFFPDLQIPEDVITSYAGVDRHTTLTLSRQTLDLSKYPEPWSKPDIYHPEVQAAIQAIDWDLVPDASVRPVNALGDIDFDSYDENEDADCWWSASNCKTPKVNYLPPDIYTCPRKGDWGLTFDDGPFNLRDSDEEDAEDENPYAEPILYDFLKKNHVKSNLFYIGSNVVTYPAAAKRALNDGHYICVHTWSHPPMTTQTNEEAVAELYWTLRAIKEATGVTPKCWRPPQGDVDDRIRAIAWQMGMRTVLWDKDTQDWALPAPGGGDLPPSEVNLKFSQWIDEAKYEQTSHGTIVLQHELNSATVRMAQKWLPQIKKVFHVVPALACNGITQPYWESGFEYPSLY